MILLPIPVVNVKWGFIDTKYFQNWQLFTFIWGAVWIISDYMAGVQ